MGNNPEAFVLGMGVNVLSASMPSEDQVLFPATSIETEAHHAVDRGKILHDVLSALLAWRPKIGCEEFIQAWNDALAFRGENIQLLRDNEAPLKGELLGLEADGSLRLKTDHKSLTVQIGEIHLRPAV